MERRRGEIETKQAIFLQECKVCCTDEKLTTVKV